MIYENESDEVSARDCYRPPVFVKGRSYMYGLSDGEMPEPQPLPLDPSAVIGRALRPLTGCRHDGSGPVETRTQSRPAPFA